MVDRVIPAAPVARVLLQVRCSAPSVALRMDRLVQGPLPRLFRSEQTESLAPPHHHP